jgi:hypothetical protein
VAGIQRHVEKVSEEIEIVSVDVSSDTAITADSVESDETFSKVFRRGFLVWAWVALLAALVSSSTVFGSQAAVLLFRGIDFGGFSSGTIILAFQVVPGMLLALTWMFFGRLTEAFWGQQFESGVLSSDDRLRSKALFFQTFRILILSWVAMLFTPVFGAYISLLRF